MLHPGSVKPVQTKYTTLYVFIYFFVVFHHKFCVFVIFISLFVKVSNFHIRASTSDRYNLNVHWKTVYFKGGKKRGKQLPHEEDLDRAIKFIRLYWLFIERQNVLKEENIAQINCCERNLATFVIFFSCNNFVFWLFFQLSLKCNDGFVLHFPPPPFLQSRYLLESW